MKIKSRFRNTPYLVLFIVLIAISVSSVYAITITLGGTLIEVLGVLNMNNNKITSLAEPTVSSDAATKNYVDNVSSGSQFIKTVERTGSQVTISGAVDGDATVDCIGSEVATGGGFHEISEADPVVFESQARFTSGVATGWTVGFFSTDGSSVTMEASVICATLQSTDPLS